MKGNLIWLILFLLFNLNQGICQKSSQVPRTVITAKNTHERITIDQLDHWDVVTWTLVKQFPLDNAGQLFAYLYHAQKAFADLSFALTGSYAGNLGPISIYVLQLFFPEYRGDTTKAPDPYSEDLTFHVAKQIRARFNQEQKQIHRVMMPQGKGSWSDEKPIGLTLSTMQPWALTRADEFRPSPPPPPTDRFWQDQAQKTKAFAEQATEDQKKKVLLWDGLKDPKEADWKSLADKYMAEHLIPLEMRLEVRSKLAKAMLDAIIAAYDAKYVFMVKRPDMIDPTIETYIPTPKHPSFPAGHSTVSKAAAVVLTYYFPENQKEWQRLAQETGMSRLWAGIHFPIDHEVGQQLGTKVGMAVLFR